MGSILGQINVLFVFYMNKNNNDCDIFDEMDDLRLLIKGSIWLNVCFPAVIENRTLNLK